MTVGAVESEKKGRSRSPLKSLQGKNENLNKILTIDEAREVTILQESAKSKNIQSFDEKLKFSPRGLTRSEIYL